MFIYLYKYTFFKFFIFFLISVIYRWKCQDLAQISASLVKPQAEADWAGSALHSVALPMGWTPQQCQQSAHSNPTAQGLAGSQVAHLSQIPAMF